MLGSRLCRNTEKKKLLAGYFYRLLRGPGKSRTDRIVNSLPERGIIGERLVNGRRIIHGGKRHLKQKTAPSIASLRWLEGGMGMGEKLWGIYSSPGCRPCACQKRVVIKNFKQGICRMVIIGTV